MSAPGHSKGKGKTPPPPPSNGKGKGKNPPPLSMHSIAPNRPRMATLSTNGDAIVGLTMSGQVLFSFPKASFDDSVSVRVLRRQIENAVIGNAFKTEVQLLTNGVPMKDQDMVSDPSTIVVKWSKGWDKVRVVDEVLLQPGSQETTGGIALPLDTDGLSFEDCSQKIIQSFSLILEKQREQAFKDWEQRVADWEQEQEKRKQRAAFREQEQEKRKQRAALQAKGLKGPPLPPPTGKAKGRGYALSTMGKGKNKGRSISPPPNVFKFDKEPPTKVMGFHVAKGCPGKLWPVVEDTKDANKCSQQVPVNNVLPVETSVPPFQELRHLYLEFQINSAFIDYERAKALESFDDACAEYCRAARQLIHIIPAGGPKSDLDIPEQRSVDIFETVRTHLGSVHKHFSVVDVQVPLPVCGFCVDLSVHGSYLQDVLEFIRIGDHESIARHTNAGEHFVAEAARLGINLKDVLPFLEVRVLDERGRLLYHVYPVDFADYVDPTQILGNVRAEFIVGPQRLPPSTQDTPSPIDLCKVATDTRSYNEHRRLALEALTIQAAAKNQKFSNNEKKGLTRIGCLLCSDPDAAVREQAQELLVAALTPESLSIISAFFQRHPYPLGDRILQEVTHMSSEIGA